MMNSSWQIEKSLALIEDAEGTRTPTEPFISAREIYFHRGSSFKFKHPSFWREVLRRHTRLTFYKYWNINCGHLLAMSAPTGPLPKPQPHTPTQCALNKNFRSPSGAGIRVRASGRPR